MTTILYNLIGLLTALQVHAAPGKIQDADVKSLAQLTAAGATASALINTAKIYDTTYAGQLSQLISKSGIAGITTAASGTVLTANGSGQGSFVAALTNPMTTVGDLIVGGSGGTPARLAAPTAGYLFVGAGTATTPVWQAPVITTVGMTAAQSIAANSILKYETKTRDLPTANYSTTTGLFTAPFTGLLRVTVVASISSGGGSVYVKVNNVGAGYVLTFSASGVIASGSIVVSVTSGQTVGIYGDTASTYQANGAQGFTNQVTFERALN